MVCQWQSKTKIPDLRYGSFTNPLQIDFDQVASECDVVSKGAAYELISIEVWPILTIVRAKRYERMVKQAGIQGGLLDNSVPPNKKNVLTPKVPKKRKPEDVTGTMKHNEDEERVLPALKRPRNEYQHGIKQEPPMSNHSPYMFHSAMPPQGPYVPRLPLPMSMYPGLPYAMPPQMQPLPQRPHGPQFPYAPHPMFPGMHNSHPYMQPMHQQLHPFQLNQNMLSHGQDNVNLALLDDMHSYDFGNGGCEAMLNGDQLPDGPVPTDTMTAKPLELTLMNPSMDIQHQIKAEPCQSSPGPFQDFDAKSVTAVPRQEVRSETLTPTVAATANLVLEEPEIADTSSEAEKHTVETAATLVPKEEDGMSCIFISD